MAVFGIERKAGGRGACLGVPGNMIECVGQIKRNCSKSNQAERRLKPASVHSSHADGHARENRGRQPGESAGEPAVPTAVRSQGARVAEPLPFLQPLLAVFAAGMKKNASQAV